MSYNIGNAENSLDSLLIVRADYDKLVLNCPDYMARTSWKNLRKQWSIAGVRCTGTESQIANLKEQLKFAKE